MEGFESLAGKKINVLTPETYEPCCGKGVHRVELPEGFPEPPKECPTWMMSARYLKFDE